MARLKVKEVALKQWRREWNATKLAEASGVSRQTVSKLWNNQTRFMNLDTLEAVAKALEVQVTDLIANEDEPEQESDENSLLCSLTS
jgi:DNA-binding Xre family transcriptional regulator